MNELSDAEKELLDFEGLRWNYAGMKEQAIRDRFDLSATRYYQRLGRIIADPAALAYNPVLVKRLRRLREARVRLRAG